MGLGARKQRVAQAKDCATAAELVAHYFPQSAVLLRAAKFVEVRLCRPEPCNVCARNVHQCDNVTMGQRDSIEKRAAYSGWHAPRSRAAAQPRSRAACSPEHASVAVRSTSPRPAGPRGTPECAGALWGNPTPLRPLSVAGPQTDPPPRSSPRPCFVSAQ
jgi:hypothetical protein